MSACSTRSIRQRPVTCRECEASLRTLLTDGPMRSKEILLRAESMKLNEKTLRRAAEALGIAQSSQTIFQNGGEWWWKLPDTPSS